MKNLYWIFSLLQVYLKTLLQGRFIHFVEQMYEKLVEPDKNKSQLTHTHTTT